MSTKYKPRTYSINDFREWKDRNELILSPKFQRRQVWSEKAKSYLMDTILKGLPMPPIFIREKIDLSTRKTVREVIDGQQRLSAILDYLKDGFKISKVHNKEYGDLYFSELPDDLQNDFLNYEISTNIVLDAGDRDVLDIFARLNTYTVPLNKNELWNAKYFGFFKQTVHYLAREYYTFWTESKILSDQKITRMGDADLTSELIIAIIDGIQDRKIIENYYKKFDDKFDEREKIAKKFKDTLDTIGEIYGDFLSNSFFSGIPPFYTLFCVIYDLLYGLRNSDNPKRIKKSECTKIRNYLQDFDSIISEIKNDRKQSPEIKEFIDDCRKHTTVKNIRERRHRYLLKFILDRLP